MNLLFFLTNHHNSSTLFISSGDIKFFEKKFSISCIVKVYISAVKPLNPNTTFGVSGRQNVSLRLCCSFKSCNQLHNYKIMS
jgi:hypothetical protein